MEQGDVYLINLDPVVNTEVGKTRPGAIISISVMNQHSPRVIIAPITSNVKRVYPFEVFLPVGTAGLDKDSKIMLDQIRSLDKRRLIIKLGVLEKGVLAKACEIVHKLISPD